ncbi:MAG: tRNA pseudouridine(55) synthase TruB [bacterium]|nr:tRNA pseudouridine(55) synthase TruB [bacterium]MDZ4248438.1 tRNA pseudouridine(55) synthase TruB [Patescibacteria group bacterium]
MQTDGFLLVDKPSGWTSHDVVAHVRKMSGIKKVGHGGTLDPMATGLLVIGLGKATKELERFVQGDKTYVAEVTLGATTATDDAEGTVEPAPDVADAAQPSHADVAAALKRFEGEIEQLPPVYSAIKTGGKKAYVEARKGRTVERKPRKVTIHDIELLEYEWPIVRFRTTVSKGTYIRSIARDLGERLGTGGYLSALRREGVGTFDVKDALGADVLDGPWCDLAEKLIPLT